MKSGINKLFLLKFITGGSQGKSKGELNEPFVLSSYLYAKGNKPYDDCRCAKIVIKFPLSQTKLSETILSQVLSLHHKEKLFTV
jgi:hypothetical protein